MTRSLAKTLRNRRYEIRFDTAFAEVMRGCAAPRAGQGGTWITAEMRAAYRRCTTLGYAHSVETWIDGELAGGLYGVAIGRVFFGESMFSRAPGCIQDRAGRISSGGSRAEGYGLIDCQMPPRTSSRSARGKFPARSSPAGSGLGRLSAIARTLARGGAGLTRTLCRS